MIGKATINSQNPMPGKWILPTDGGVPHWLDPDGSYKYKAACSQPCPASCEVCPGLGDVCTLAEHVSSGAFNDIPTATVEFSCGLVSMLDGYSGYIIYPTLIDDSYHAATGADPSLNLVGQTAHIFFVANPCAGTEPWKQGTRLKCTILDSKRRTRRNIVRSTIRCLSSMHLVDASCVGRSHATRIRA
jgi:hypothetical protein|eukprot:COSAG01_NODE_5266_length_4373_cov_3.147871_3_plen_188_part_00